MGYAIPAAIGAAFATGKKTDHLHRRGRQHDDEPTGASNIQHHQLPIKIFC